MSLDVIAAFAIIGVAVLAWSPFGDQISKLVETRKQFKFDIRLRQVEQELSQIREILVLNGNKK